MKFKIIAVGIGSMVFAYTASAVDFEDEAQVISSTPIVQLVSQPICQAQTGASLAPPSQSIVGGVVGGVTGGLLGTQLGRRKGKAAAIIIGAAGGALIGSQIANSSSSPDVPSAVTCSNVLRDVVIGYSVVYRYSGHDLTTSLQYDPGSVIKVGIGVIDEGGIPDPVREGATAIPPPRDYPPPSTH